MDKKYRTGWALSCSNHGIRKESCVFNSLFPKLFATRAEARCAKKKEDGCSDFLRVVKYWLQL